MDSSLPTVVVGAGPIGLAAAAHLLQRGLNPIVLEAGAAPGAAVARWAHVRMFSTWALNIDPATRGLLEEHGWMAPADDDVPTGRDLLDRYLLPLAALPEIAPRVRLNTRVTGVARLGFGRVTTVGREAAPFVVRFEDAHGEGELLAQAVIDASGTFGTPNPLGASGLPALGERAHQAHITYGIPDVLGAERSRYAGRRVLVAGSGHSAFNAVLDLMRLTEEAPGTTITWVVRRRDLANLFGGGQSDQLPERGRLGTRVKALVERRALALVSGFKTSRVESVADGLIVSDGERALGPVDELIVATGLRPDLEPLRELRLALDEVVQSPAALAPLIDPNVHSCGNVPPHGAEELKHPEDRFYIVGMKSYGRAPTFLLRTGYEQVRSVVAALAGDWDAARRVELVLPETGVCSSAHPDTLEDDAASGCCGGPAPEGVNACCVKDADAKAAGEAGCGCGTSTPVALTLPVLNGGCCVS